MKKNTNETKTSDREGGRLFRLHEAARHLGLSVRTVQAMIAAGDLSVVRFGRRVVVHPDDLAQFVDARRGATTSNGGRS